MYAKVRIVYFHENNTPSQNHRHFIRLYSVTAEEKLCSDPGYFNHQGCAAVIARGQKTSLPNHHHKAGPRRVLISTLADVSTRHVYVTRPDGRIREEYERTNELLTRDAPFILPVRPFGCLSGHLKVPSSCTERVTSSTGQRGER
ncbi:hypothetical protein LSAT2_030281 [Lamellibrachia satsuma]|nr:hypothetical protein LSAT2_030281 [Lamellibrachia satsuma]